MPICDEAGGFLLRRGGIATKGKPLHKIAPTLIIKVNSRRKSVFIMRYN